MHEYGLCEGILGAVHARASGRAVAWVRVRAGVRHGVDADTMTQAFQLVSEGTEAEGATLDLVTVPARLRCGRCGHTGTTADLLAVCPRCGSGDVTLHGGDELVLESLGYAPSPAPG